MIISTPSSCTLSIELPIKLIFEIAEAIRAEYNTGLISQKKLGIKYSVSQDTIFNIVKCKTYIVKDKV